ncbi:MAG: hypothetical protein S4CHLAM102_02550 [Chlamydiia bacterium]|nr:hypothetical protein [Chlamydiia bacterium]
MPRENFQIVSYLTPFCYEFHVGPQKEGANPAQTIAPWRYDKTADYLSCQDLQGVVERIKQVCQGSGEGFFIAWGMLKLTIFVQGDRKVTLEGGLDSFCWEKFESKTLCPKLCQATSSSPIELKELSKTLQRRVKILLN